MHYMTECERTDTIYIILYIINNNGINNMVNRIEIMPCNISQINSLICKYFQLHCKSTKAITHRISSRAYAFDGV